MNKSEFRAFAQHKDIEKIEISNAIDGKFDYIPYVREDGTKSFRRTFIPNTRHWVFSHWMIRVALVRHKHMWFNCYMSDGILEICFDHIWDSNYGRKVPPKRAFDRYFNMKEKMIAQS